MSSQFPRKFTLRPQISAYETGNCDDISIRKQNLEFSKRNFHYSAAKLWNEILLQIRNSPTIFAFKRKLKRVLATLAIIPKARSLRRAALIDFCIIDISTIPYLRYIVTCLYILIYILMYSC